MGDGTAQALNGRVVKVRMPESADARVNFMADIENLDIVRAAPAARVVINARTGSVVVNQAVTRKPCAVAHGALSVTISSTPQVSQPASLAATAVVANDDDGLLLLQDVAYTGCRAATRTD